MEDIWKDLPRYKGDYQISNLGNIKSFKRKNVIILKPGESSCGYYIVGLVKNKKKKSELVHRLVLETFVGPCPEGMECCHKDGNPKNNKLENLRWDTKKENNQDRIAHGTNNVGESNPHSILSESMVLDILRLLKTNIKIKDIAKKYNVAPGTISNISNGNAWRNITKFNKNCNLKKFNKLTTYEKYLIKKYYNKKFTSQKWLAEIFGVDQSAISRITKQ